MEIKYDEVKNQTNIETRGISFDKVFDFDFESALQRFDDRFDYPEARYQAMGFIGDRLHVLIYTEIENGIRVISLRKANKREVKLYEQKTKP